MNAKNVDNDAALMISNPDAMPEVGVDNERGNIMWEIPIEVIATEDSDANAQQIARQARSFLHAQERRARDAIEQLRAEVRAATEIAISESKALPPGLHALTLRPLVHQALELLEEPAHAEPPH